MERNRQKKQKKQGYLRKQKTSQVYYLRTNLGP
jgi:hypothetical protein